MPHWCDAAFAATCVRTISTSGYSDAEPDVVLRKEAQAGAPATSIRAWLTPIRFNGALVYVAQVGRPVGGRFARGGTGRRRAA